MKIKYADPRARRLQAHAFVALALVSVPACFLGAFVTTAGGDLNIVGYSAAVAVMALSLSGALCLFLAPRVEARYAAEYARQLAEAQVTTDVAGVEEIEALPPAARPAFQTVPMPAPPATVPAPPATVPAPARDVYTDVPGVPEPADAVVWHIDTSDGGMSTPATPAPAVAPQ